jgi:hypothetical protein
MVQAAAVPQKASGGERKAEREDKERLCLIALQEIDALLTDSKQFADPALRVRLWTRAAETISRRDEERAKGLLRAALDETTFVEVSAKELYALRTEIIDAAQQLDDEFAQSLIARLENRSSDGDEAPAVLSRDGIERVSDQSALFLDAAIRRLEANRIPEAVALAKRHIATGYSPRIFPLLAALLDKNPQAYQDVLDFAISQLAVSPRDPNQVLLYGCWLFFEGSSQFGTLSDGTVAISAGQRFDAPPSPPDEDLVRRYLKAAFVALSRFPVEDGGAACGPACSLELKRFAVTQLLGVYAAHEPELGASLQAQIGAPLAAGQTAAPGGPVLNLEAMSVADAIAEIDKIQDVARRDFIYFNAAQRCVYAGDDIDAARALASKLSEDEAKARALDLVTFVYVDRSIERGDVDDALRLARKHLGVDLWSLALARAAKRAADHGDLATFRERADQVARALERAGDKEIRAKVRLYLSAAAISRDALAAFELADAAAKDINELPEFDPGDADIPYTVTVQGRPSRFNFGGSESLLAVAGLLATKDLLRSLELARGFKGEAVRARSVLEVCRTVLASCGSPPKPADPAPSSPDRKASHQPRGRSKA